MSFMQLIRCLAFRLIMSISVSSSKNEFLFYSHTQMDLHSKNGTQDWNP